MPNIKVTFADGTVKIFHEEQAFRTIIKTDNGTSLGEIFSLWYHATDGLIPSFTELLTKCDFFFDVENPNIVYSSNSVIRFEV